MYPFFSNESTSATYFTASLSEIEGVFILTLSEFDADCINLLK